MVVANLIVVGKSYFTSLLCGAKEEKRKKIVVSRTKQTLSDAVEIRDWSNAKRRIRGLE